MLQLERIERRVLGERQAVMQAMVTWGAEGVDLPTVQDAWDDFDVQLAAAGRRSLRDERTEDILGALGL